ncbi:MAG: hypothetical protein JO082_01290 [Mycobacterium sp.]|nr:hypothetical protein [Mycobacterium sp.]
MTRVLLVGFTADAVDLSDLPVDLESLRKSIAEGDAEVEAAGYDVERAWIGTDHYAGVDEVRKALTNSAFDIVMVGNGVRGNPQYTVLFEQVVNVVHELAPRARFAFNADPPSTLEALRRNT